MAFWLSTVHDDAGPPDGHDDGSNDTDTGTKDQQYNTWHSCSNGSLRRWDLEVGHQNQPACHRPAPCETNWELARAATHPMLTPPHLERLELRQVIGTHMNQLREAVVDEIEELILVDREEETLTWWKGLQQHIAPVYYNTQHHQIAQIPNCSGGGHAGPQGPGLRP